MQQYNLSGIEERDQSDCFAACDMNQFNKKYFIKLLKAYNQIERKKGKRPKGLKKVELNDNHEYQLEDEYRFVLNEIKGWSLKLKYFNRLSSIFENKEIVVKCLIALAKETELQELKPWWDGECNKDLVLGTYKFGFYCGELLKNESSLCFARKLSEDDEMMMKEDSEEEEEERVIITSKREFPTDDELFRHIKRIIQWLDKKYKSLAQEDESDD